MLGLFFPNRTTSTVTLGSWTLAASNVGDPDITKVARSTNDATSSTKFCVDLGAAYALRAFALINHNLSSAAQWRILLGTTAGASDVYAGTLANWLSVTFDSSMAALGMQDGEYLRDGTPALIVLSTLYSARYVTVEISDTSNPDNYVQIGRFFCGGGFIPTYNAAYGLKDGWTDLSTKDYSESGVLWATPRRRLRKVQFVLEDLSLDEGDILHEMQRVLGEIDEVLYVPDIADMAVSQRYGMLGTIAEMSDLEYPFYRSRKLPLVIKQKG
jgi:hypothetical protein